MENSKKKPSPISLGFVTKGEAPKPTPPAKPGKSAQEGSKLATYYKRINIGLTEDTYKRLKVLGVSKNEDVQAMVTAAIESYLAKNSK